MSNLRIIYDTILSNLSSYDPELIYFSVGSAMGYYNKINPNQNQQYPFPILNKYKGKKKVIILIDPSLETPLKMETYIKLNLVVHEKNLRLLVNDDTLVFAVNHYYYFDNHSNDPNFKLHSGFLIDVVNFTLYNKSKLIIQNFSGPCIQKRCNEMFDYFPRRELIANVIFDVSNSDGNCGFDFDKHPVLYDEKDNFIQSKFEKLSIIKKLNPEYFSRLIINRINHMNYELTRKLRVIRGEVDKTSYEDENIQSLFKTLSLIYPEINSTKITEETLIHCMQVLLSDICDSLNIDKSIISKLIEAKFNQSEVINLLAPLKSLL